MTRESKRSPRQWPPQIALLLAAAGLLLLRPAGATKHDRPSGDADDGADEEEATIRKRATSSEHADQDDGDNDAAKTKDTNEEARSIKDPERPQAPGRAAAGPQHPGCGRQVRMPARLPESHALPQCTSRQAKELLTPQVTGGTSDQPIQDCRHSIGVKFRFHSIYRSDLGTDGRIAEENTGRYVVRMSRAGPNDIVPMVTDGVLDRIEVMSPGLHSVGERQFTAEVHLFARSKQPDGANVTVVIPIETAWAWDAPIDTTFQFLSRPADYSDPSLCGWHLTGVGLWIRNGFRCPPYELLTNRLLPRAHDRALHYQATAACPHVFVVADSLQVTAKQMQDAVALGWGSGSSGGGSGGSASRRAAAPSLRPSMVVASMLAPEDTFTVLTEQEMLRRNAVFFLSVVSAALAVLGVYLLVRLRQTDVWMDMKSFGSDRCVLQNTLLDHWLMYMTSIAVPWMAFALHSTNSATGIPYEFAAALLAAAFAHMLHEAAMMYQIGSTVQCLSYMAIARLGMRSWLAVVQIGLHVQFAIFAIIHVSCLGYLSIIVFLVFDVLLQLVLGNYYGHSNPDVVFKLRHFEVINACLSKQAKQKESNDSDKELLTQSSRPPSRAPMTESRDRDKEGAARFVVDNVPQVPRVGDCLQLLLALAFSQHHGWFPFVIVTAAVDAWSVATCACAGCLPKQLVLP